MKKITYASPLRPMIMLTDDKALYGLWFADQKYFAGQAPSISGIILAPQATSFQKAVYHELLQIPFGQTTTYKALAAKVNSSPRAIGNAIARNQILLIIPCHRVLGANGALTGYAGGLERKQALLKLEGSFH